MVQTWLASSPVRLAAGNPLSRCSQEVIVRAGEGVHLSGFLTRADGDAPRGLAVLIHGWEGSADAPYMVFTGSALVRAGFDVFRLNLRDHGGNHQLNSGIFMGTLIDETFGAVRNVAEEYNRSDSLYLLGVSLGGNFALRIAALCGKDMIDGLKQVVAVNPPLNPCDATVRLDRNPMIRRHFLGKWKASLRIKQKAFPHIYDFSHIEGADNCMDLTEDLIPRHSDCTSAADYFSRYTLKEGILDRAAVPVTVITAEDDPIIHAEDFRRAKVNGNVRLIMLPYGGHCGYIENLSMRSWLDRKVPELFLAD
nr:alpha/beta fold hydrolase [Spirochaeta isovalerica]